MSPLDPTKVKQTLTLTNYTWSSDYDPETKVYEARALSHEEEAYREAGVFYRIEARTEASHHPLIHPLNIFLDGCYKRIPIWDRLELMTQTQPIAFQLHHVTDGSTTTKEKLAPLIQVFKEQGYEHIDFSLKNTGGQINGVVIAKPGSLSDYYPFEGYWDLLVSTQNQALPIPKDSPLTPEFKETLASYWVRPLSSWLSVRWHWGMPKGLMTVLTGALSGMPIEYIWAKLHYQTADMANPRTD